MSEPYRSICDLIAENARRFPAKAYLHSVERGDEVSYGELAAHTDGLARLLRTRGLAANDRVLLLADNSPECVVAYLGVLRHGATVAIVNPELNATHLGQMLRAVQPELVLHSSDLDLTALGHLRDDSWLVLRSLREGGVPGLVGELAGEPDADATASCAGPDDAAVIFYTSGTEAQPKGVVYTHRTLYCNFDAVAEMVALSEADRLLDFRSISWISAQEMAIGGPLTRGATVYLAERFSSSRYFGWLDEFKITIGVCVPTGISMLLNQSEPRGAAPRPHLRFMTSSSAALPESHWRRFEEQYGITIAQGYGSSEAGWISGSHRENRRIGTAGRPLKYQQVRVADAAGDTVATGEQGEICVGGSHQQAHAYLLDSGAVERLAGDEVATGDLGFLDTDGYLHVTGRVKELIIRGGVNIAPAEIDDVLAAHGDVAEAATIGVPDPIYGEEIISFVVPRSGAAVSPEELLEHCRGVLPAFKSPREIRLAHDLPRTARGKLDRATLAARWVPDAAT